MNRLQRSGRRKSFKERLGFTGLGCCGGGAALRETSNMSVRAEEEDEELEEEHELVEDSTTQIQQTQNEIDIDQACVTQITPAETVSGMNLATALAAERQFRAHYEEEESDGVEPNGAISTTIATPLRVSLMRLLEESDAVNENKEGGGRRSGREEGSCDGVCCVCMGRRKGAAFIPCGHTFCRVCSRELWLNRGSCPICNRSILEILDIF